MKFLRNDSAFGIGLAIFSMFFGAGNSIFPLFIGVVAKEYWWLALAGLCLTTVLMPLLGIFSMSKMQGDPLKFFGRIGKLPGFILAFFVIIILGPLGSAPRCIAFSYATIIPDKSLAMPIYAAIACLLVLFCTLKKKYILPIIGFLFTPVLLISLIVVILMGMFSGSELQIEEGSIFNSFSSGFFEGYQTMDLMASLFFSSTIIHLLNRVNSSREKVSQILTKGGVIGGALLTLVYGGLTFIASSYAKVLQEVPKEQMLSTLANHLLGSHASLLVRMIIALACLTTAIALISAFTDFMQNQVLKNRFSYTRVLVASIILMYFIAILEFDSISQMLNLPLKLIYPGLIVLTLFQSFSSQRRKATIS